MIMTPEVYLQEIENSGKRVDLPFLEVGDKIELVLKQAFNSKQLLTFKGIVIGKRNSNKLSYSFTVIRDIPKLVITSVFFFHLSPIISIKKTGEKIPVRRAKLYYLKRKLTKKKIGT